MNSSKYFHLKIFFFKVYILVYICTLIINLLIFTSTSTSWSGAKSLYADLSEDPFLDPYIETILHMNIKDIMAMPKMNDEEFFQYLLDDNADTTTRSK